MPHNIRNMLLTLTCFSVLSPAFASTHYRVEDKQALDKESYQGYIIYRQWCARCHGAFGQGGPFSPDLTDSLKKLSQQDFNNIVTSGSNEQGYMPAWHQNQQVMQSIDAIYTYLKARSDGAISAIRPQLIQ